MSRYVFPRWSNLLLPTIIVVGMTVPLYAVLLVAYGFSPKTLDQGYMPLQPVPFSHALHAGTLGMDCRYCHNTVEHAAHAAIPPTQTCMNCHTQVVKDSPKLAEVRRSYEEGMPVEWIKVHTLAQYAYFDHSAHINRGVGCVSCHGRVDQMEVVYQSAPLSMGWCLDCHRNPEPHLRPVSQVTNLAWDQRTELTRSERLALRDLYHINPSENCSTCHR
ncbi:MAG TPA: cytochrome c3 family protein [Phycisphaerales bacterium]|nr:cytochrome c3 family protein [Phycisphaerales bacterium]HMP36014.1 cytochrome c3 family protein [Phycisphaerales bacterium]